MMMFFLGFLSGIIAAFAISVLYLGWSTDWFMGGAGLSEDDFEDINNSKM